MTKNDRRGRSLNFTTLERGRFHLIVRQSVREHDREVKRPVLWLIIPDDAGLNRLMLYQPLLDYFADHSGMSFKWMKNAARGFGALVDYALSSAAHPLFEQWKQDGVLPRRVFRGLATSLLRGTMEVSRNGRILDHTGLYWGPLGKRQAKVLLSALTSHFRWMRDEPTAATWVQAASTDAASKFPLAALALVSELMIRRKNSLLGHLKGVKREPSHPFPGVVKNPGRTVGAKPSFPAKYLNYFLHHAFLDKSGECDEAAQLLAHLIFMLGIRKSEGFQLYTSDVQFVREEPWLFFHHPQSGMILNIDGGLITREDYLQRFGLVPRNDDTAGINFAGWKGMADADQGTPGFFLPIQYLRERTASLLKRYIFVTRPAIMARRLRSLRDNPYLLVTSQRYATGRGGEVGDPYTMSAFKHSWEKAIRNVGLRYDDPDMMIPRKWLGTTPHGGRHFYGKFLVTSGVEGSVIQSCMHHVSLEAHRVYTQFSAHEINEIVSGAAEGKPHDQTIESLRKEFMSHFEHPPRFHPGSNP